MTTASKAVVTVDVAEYEVRIAGCPSGGLEALDFRRQRELPDDRADDKVVLRLVGGEDLLRVLARAGACASNMADGTIVLDRAASVAPGAIAGRNAIGQLYDAHHQSGYRAELEPEVVRAILAADLAALMDGEGRVDRWRAQSMLLAEALVDRAEEIQRERDERRAAEAAAAAEREASMAAARELLADELARKDREIAALRQTRDELRETISALKEEIHAANERGGE